MGLDELEEGLFVHHPSGDEQARERLDERAMLPHDAEGDTVEALQVGLARKAKLLVSQEKTCGSIRRRRRHARRGYASLLL